MLSDAHAIRPVAVREIPPHCATCQHFHAPPSQAGYGECRLYPRGITGSQKAGTLALRYPTVAATDYCGAHPDAASLG